MGAWPPPEHTAPPPPSPWLPEPFVPYVLPFAATVLLLAVAAIAMLRGASVPAREAGAELLPLFLLGALAALTALSMARVGPGPRHFINWHYLAVLPGLCAGWIFASEGFGYYPPVLLALPVLGAAVACGQIVATLTIHRVAAAWVAATVWALAAAPLRPFTPAVLNLVFPLLAAGLAWGAAKALHRPTPEDDPLAESGPGAAMLGYFTFNAVALGVLAALLAVFAKPMVQALLELLGFAQEAAPERTGGVQWHYLVARITASAAAAAAAAAIAAWRTLVTAKPGRAWFYALLAGAGPLLGGQPLSGEGIATAAFGGALVAVGVGLACAGGRTGKRAPRPIVAAMVAAWLALNLFEPRSAALRISGPWTALACVVEGIWLFAISAAGYHWGIRGLRAMYPELKAPRPVDRIPPGPPPSEYRPTPHIGLVKK
jgi:hypothetical protein